MEQVTFKYNDTDCKLYVANDWVSESIKESQTFYEKSLLDHIYKKFGEGKIFVDVGANIGNHTYFFAKICKAEKVYAFDPDSEYFGLLYHNTKDFFGTVLLVNCALGIGTEEMGKILGKKAIIDKLDNYVDYCDVIKIDVEGMESDVIVGAERLIHTCHPTLYLEAKDDQAKKRIDFYMPAKKRWEGKWYQVTEVFRSGTPIYEYTWKGEK